MSEIEQEALARKTVADLIRQAGATDLVVLLKSIRPQFGAVGSRDQDVSRQQREIDVALELLERPVRADGVSGAQEDSWTAITNGMPEEGDPLWLHISRGEVITGTKRWRQGWSPDFWETEDGELSFDAVTHWMPRRAPAPPRAR
ncbi:hypothetical protein [Cupriavidus sp. CP313]